MNDYPVIENARWNADINVWTVDPPNDGAGKRSQHPGVMVGWTTADPSTRQPVFKSSGDAHGKITLKR